MTGQGVGLPRTFAVLALLAGIGMAQASPDFAERKDIKFQPPQGVVHAAVEPAAKTPMADPAGTSGDEPRPAKASRGEAGEPRHRWREERSRVHRADPIDVIAARAKVVRTRLRARLWRLTHRRF